MSLTVDYITMPPKSQEISQIQQSEHIKQDVENQQTAAMFEQTVQKETKTAITEKIKNLPKKTRLKILTRQRVDYLI